MASIQYEQDNDERTASGVNGNGLGSGWAGQLYPYVKSTAVFVCPDDSGSVLTTGHPTSYLYNRNCSIYSYDGYNDPNGETASPGQPLSQFTAPAKTVLLCEVTGSGYYDVSQVYTNDTGGSSGPWNGDETYGGGSPAGCGLGGEWDIVGYHTNFGGGAEPAGEVQYATGYLRNSEAAAGDPTGKTYFTGPTGRHTGGANYVMCDGHAKFFQPSAVSGGYPNGTPGDCGSKGVSPYTASTVDCADSSIQATFNIN